MVLFGWLDYYTNGTAGELASRWFVLIVVILLTLNFQVTLYKFYLYLQSLLYLLFTKDKRYKKPTCPDSFVLPTDPTQISKRTIVFVRHGESTWNETFNRGYNPVFFIPRLIYAVLYEFYLLLRGQLDSWFYDSPLSHVGIEQALGLRKYLSTIKRESLSPEELELVDILRGAAGQSVIISSNLRRAISTMCIGLHERLQNGNDKIKIMPFLQEISRNPDTLSITPARKQPVESFVEKSRPDLKIDHHYSQLDVSSNSGNKALSSTGLLRMRQFCDWSFNENKNPHIIVGGHSLWFREFFRAFLPHSFNHVAKTGKIVNGGAVAFTLLSFKSGDQTVYKIDPASIKVIYGGW